MRIKQLKVVDLVPYDRNSRTHSDEQVDQVAKSIEEFGFTNPILVGEDNVVIAGHGRLLAAKKLGLKQVPTIELSHLTAAQRRAYVIADNKLAEASGWDKDLLALELGALSSDDYDLSLLGFDDKELTELLDNSDLPGLVDDDQVPEKEEIAVTAQSDLWLLGEHRVLCDDSTQVDSVKVLCDGLVDMVWTDPPYNVDYSGSNGKKIMNDSMGDDKFLLFLTDLFVAAFEVTKKGGAIYIAHADSESLNFRQAAHTAGFMIKQCLVWVKNTFAMGRQDYQWQHEPILYGWKPGGAHNWYGDRKKKTVIDDQNDLSNMSVAELKEIIGQMLNTNNTSVIYENKPKRNGEHPTMKPVRLVSHMIKNSSKRGDAVLDVCGGSGSTLIACEKMGRLARLMELDPVYCDVIIRRWQEFTGKEAILKATGQTFTEVSELRAKAAA